MESEDTKGWLIAVFDAHRIKKLPPLFYAAAFDDAAAAKAAIQWQRGRQNERMEVIGALSVEACHNLNLSTGTVKFLR